MADDLMTDDIEAGRGRWVTIQGRRVFIGGDKQGEQLGNARAQQLNTARHQEIGAAAKGKSSWEGFGAAEILRLMGKEGLSYAEAKRACEALGLTPAEPTVRRQLGEGKKGISIPDLDDRQRGLFDDVVNKIRGEKPEPEKAKPEPKKDGPTIYTKDNSPLMGWSPTEIIRAASAAGLEKGQTVQLLKHAGFDPAFVDSLAKEERFARSFEKGQTSTPSLSDFTPAAKKQFDELVKRVQKGEPTIYTKDNSPLLKESSTLTIAHAASAAGLEKGQIVRLLKEAAFDPKLVDHIAATEHFNSYIESGKLAGPGKAGSLLFSDEAQKQFDELVLRVKGADDLKVKKGDKIPPEFVDIGSRELIWHAGKRGLTLQQTKDLLERVGMDKEWAKMDPNNFAMKLALRTGRQGKIEKDRALTPKQEKAFDEEVLKMTGGKGPNIPKSGRQVREEIKNFIETQPEMKKIFKELEEARKDFNDNLKSGSIQDQSRRVERIRELEQKFNTESFFGRSGIHKLLALPEEYRAKVEIEYKGHNRANLGTKEGLAKRSAEFLSTVISNDYADVLSIKAKDTDSKSKLTYRSYYGMDGTIYMANQAGFDVWTHEAGHYLEDMHRDALKASKDFLEFRTEGEPLKKLNEVVKGSSYSNDEKTREDKFIDPYIGKDYGGSATEVMSMGLQYLHKDPVELMTKDPEMFDHVVNTARGIHGDPEYHEEQYNRWQKLTAK